LSFTLIRCDGEDGRKFDPDVGRDNGEGDVRRFRSSINGVFCSRFIVGALIDDDDDDDDVTVGRDNFVVDAGRNKWFCWELISNGNGNGGGIGGRNNDKSLLLSINGNGGGKNVDWDDGGINVVDGRILFVGLKRTLDLSRCRCSWW